MHTDFPHAIIIKTSFINVKVHLYITCNYHSFFLKIAQHDGNVTKWYDAYFNKPRPYFTNEGFPNPPCTEGKTKFSGNEEIYVIGADHACMIPGNEDKICNGPLKPKKQYL